MFRKVSSKLRRRRVDTDVAPTVDEQLARTLSEAWRDAYKHHTVEDFERQAIRSIRNPPIGSTAQRKSSSQTRVSTADVSHPSSVLFLPSDGGSTCDPPPGSDCG